MTIEHYMENLIFYKVLFQPVISEKGKMLKMVILSACFGELYSLKIYFLKELIALWLVYGHSQQFSQLHMVPTSQAVSSFVHLSFKCQLKRTGIFHENFIAHRV